MTESQQKYVAVCVAMRELCHIPTLRINPGESDNIYCKIVRGVPSAARSIDKPKEISASLADSFIVPVDMTKPDEVRRMVQKTCDYYGRLDVLINNARRGLHAPIEHIDLDDFAYIISLNVFGPLVAMQSAIPIMRNMAVAP